MTWISRASLTLCWDRGEKTQKGHPPRGQPAARLGALWQEPRTLAWTSAARCSPPTSVGLAVISQTARRAAPRPPRRPGTRCSLSAFARRSACWSLRREQPSLCVWIPRLQHALNQWKAAWLEGESVTSKIWGDDLTRTAKQSFPVRTHKGWAKCQARSDSPRFVRLVVLGWWTMDACAGSQYAHCIILLSWRPFLFSSVLIYLKCILIDYVSDEIDQFFLK